MLNIQERIESLTPAQRELLLKKIRQRAEARPAPIRIEPPAIPSVARRERMALSLAQERLWFIEQFEETQGAYTVATAGYIEGPLDRAAFSQSLAMVVERHEILRTTFGDSQGKPFQRIAAEPTVDCRYRDLRSLSPERRDAEKDVLIQDLAAEPFVLATGPLLRAGLSRLEDERYLLLVAMHHIVTDGWSLGVFFRDLAHFYALATGKTNRQLAGPAVQYADYAAWQRALEQSGGFRPDVDYWKRCLDGAPPLLALPTDRPRQASANMRGATGSFSIPAGLTSDLRALASRTQSTLFMVTLAGFAVLLKRYSRQDDIVIGTPVANREMVELEQLVGFFVNTLALRLVLTGDLTVDALIDRVRGVVLEAFSHQRAPFEQVVDACVKERNLGYSPLFQVMFAFQNAPMPDAALGDCRFTPIAVERGSTHFDLGFFLAENAGRIEVSFEYSTDLFDAATIHRLANHYVRILEGMVCGPALPIARIPLMSPEEWSAITCGWREVRQETKTAASVVSLFARQCQRDGGRIAIAAADCSISYDELNIRANRIATHLRNRGVGPDIVVALALDRSMEMIAAVVGILRAGGAYLPVDLANPAERSRAILADSGASILLTSLQADSEYAISSQIVADGGTVILHIDDISPVADQEVDPFRPPCPEDLAYVLYTSGSTGKPKGVAMPHRPLANLVAWQLAEEGFDRPTITLQFSPLCFDVSFQEIFCTLCSGGTLVLIDEHIRRDSEALLEVLDRLAVERIFLPFVALQQLAITAGKTARYPSTLRDVITAGEQLRITDPVRRFFEELPACRLHNQYGPTECHVVTSLTLPADVSTWPLLPSIGRPIAGSAIYILEPSMDPAPAGVPGELFIGGEVCARGYLNRPELTVERFIADPFRTAANARMYRSGDLARHLPNGIIECLGRVDHQVKIRGFRVELQEIESVLDCLPQVKECAVTVHSGEESFPELVAYVVCHSGDDLSSLRARLAEKLPSYMVPRYLVPMAAMPLTPSGKIDRQALPVPGPAATDSVRDGAPCTPIETILCELWARVLGLPAIGVTDNFFDCGGHSLLATQLISEINELFSLALPIRSLFESPTVADFAGRIQADDRLAADEAPLLRSWPGDDRMVLSFAQERLWLVEQSLGRSAVYNMPVALRCDGPLDIEVLEQAILAVIARHETLRTVFAEDDKGAPFQTVREAIAFSLARRDATTVGSAADQRLLIERIVHEEAGTPFDLERGPLIRAGVIALDADSHIILLTFHHIICDGWSIGVFARDLTACYTALLAGTAPALEPLAIQYHDFASWQRRLLAGSRGASLRQYWQKQLEATPLELELPADFTPPAVASHAGDRLSFTLSRELCRALQDFSSAQASTLFMTMLSAFSWLIFRYTGQERFLVGTPIANRNRKQLGPLIGFFVNMLPIRIDLAGDPTFVDLLGQVRRTCIDAYTHQDMPFDELVRLLQPERSLNRHPLVQVVFVLQNTPEPALRLGATTLTPVGREQTVAKYDLLMSLSPDGGELHGALEYSTELFSAATIRGIVDLYTRIVAGVVENPSARILDPEISGIGSEKPRPAPAADDISFDF
jgi:amino acid adenylation domain-containing protein